MSELVELCTWGLLILSAVLIGGMLLALAVWVIGCIGGFFWLVGVIVRDLWLEYGPARAKGSEEA